MDKVIYAANRVEDISAHLKQLVIELREHPDDVRRAYSLLYYARQDLGRVVATLGVGVPPRVTLD